MEGKIFLQNKKKKERCDDVDDDEMIDDKI